MKITLVLGILWVVAFYQIIWYASRDKKPVPTKWYAAMTISATLLASVIAFDVVEYDQQQTAARKINPVSEPVFNYGR